MALFFVNNGFDFFEFYKLINRLEGNFSVFINCPKVDHFVHVIRRYRTDYLFVVFVIPYLLILLEFTFVHLEEQSEWSRFVDFFSDFMLLVSWICMVFLLANFYIGIRCFLLLGFVANCDVDAVGVVLSGFVILGLQTGLAEQTFNAFNAGLKLECFKVDFFKSLQYFCLPNFGHNQYLK